MHICFPQSLTFLPSLLSPCGSCPQLPQSSACPCHTGILFSLFLCTLPGPSTGQRQQEKRKTREAALPFFFSHSVSKPITRTTTTITTTIIIMEVLRYRSLARLGRDLSVGGRGFPTSLQGGIGTFEDCQLPVTRLFPGALRLAEQR